MTAYQVKPQPLTRSRKPVRSKRYLQWIRKQPSCVSNLWPSEACHSGMHGVSQRASDLDAIPLTRREHIAFDRDPQGFAALHGLNVERIIADLNQRYLQELGCEDLPERKPAGRAEG